MAVTEVELSNNEILDAARQRARDQQDEEKWRVANGAPPWPVYNTQIRKIELRRSVGSMLGEPFKNFLKRRRAEKGKVFVMEGMGQGGFYHHYKVDGEVAITLVDFRTEEQKAEDKQRGKLVIPGDILDPDIWLQEQQYIQELDQTALPGIDLAICSPGGGWDTVKGSYKSTDNSALVPEWTTVNNMVGSLSPRGGTLLVEMSGSLHYGNWTSQIRQTRGLTAFHRDRYVRISKTEAVSDTLPMIV